MLQPPRHHVGIEAVIAAMSDHPTVEGIQGFSCSLLVAVAVLAFRIVPNRQPGDPRVEPNRIEPNRIETNRINSNRIANACALNGAQLVAHKPPIAPLGRMMRNLVLLSSTKNKDGFKDTFRMLCFQFSLRSLNMLVN